jgi:RHS repeat-associated protein
VLDFHYDQADRLLDVDQTRTSSGTGSLAAWNYPQEFHYRYDAANNRLSEQIVDGGSGGTAHTVELHVQNAAKLNQVGTLDGDSPLSPVRVRGTVNEPTRPNIFDTDPPYGLTQEGMVAQHIDDDPPTTDVAPLLSEEDPTMGNPKRHRFSGYVEIPAGETSLVEIRPYDLDDNPPTTPFEREISLDEGDDRVLTYDENGNLIAQEINDGAAVSGGTTISYAWDVADRLIEVEYDYNVGDTKSAEFEYDAFGRRVRITKKTNGTPDSDYRYVWRGLAIAQEREWDDNALVREFFPQGERHNGSDVYLYGRNHLGSVVSVWEDDGDLAAHYEYDPYGRRTVQVGSNLTPMGFTGHFTLQVGASAGEDIVLAPYRAYDPELGRWISKDPIKEDGGVNLYAYCHNNPVVRADLTGLDDLVILLGKPGEYGYDGQKETAERLVKELGLKKYHEADAWGKVSYAFFMNVHKCGGRKNGVAYIVGHASDAGGLRLWHNDDIDLSGSRFIEEGLGQNELLIDKLEGNAVPSAAVIYGCCYARDLHPKRGPVEGMKKMSDYLGGAKVAGWDKQLRTCDEDSCPTPNDLSSMHVRGNLKVFDPARPGELINNDNTILIQAGAKPWLVPTSQDDLNQRPPSPVPPAITIGPEK